MDLLLKLPGWSDQWVHTNLAVICQYKHTYTWHNNSENLSFVSRINIIPVQMCIAASIHDFFFIWGYSIDSFSILQCNRYLCHVDKLPSPPNYSYEYVYKEFYSSKYHNYSNYPENILKFQYWLWAKMVPNRQLVGSSIVNRSRLLFIQCSHCTIIPK